MWILQLATIQTYQKKMLNGQNKFTTQGDSKVKIKIFVDKCISAATCVIHAPATFDLDDEGIAYVKESTWDDALKIYEAAKSCPTKAVIIEDQKGAVLWPK